MVERFGAEQLHFAGTPLRGSRSAFVGETGPDPAGAVDGNGVLAEHVIRGGHGIAVWVHDPEEVDHVRQPDGKLV